MRETVTKFMTGSERACTIRRVYLHDSAAPTSVGDTAVRETAEESGVAVRITGLVGLFTDPRARRGERRR